MDVANLRAFFWAGVAAVAVIAVVVTVGAYSGEFGFSGGDQARATGEVQVARDAAGEAITPDAGDAGGEGAYEDDGYEHDDSEEWDDQESE